MELAEKGWGCDECILMISLLLVLRTDLYISIFTRISVSVYPSESTRVPISSGEITMSNRINEECERTIVLRKNSLY